MAVVALLATEGQAADHVDSPSLTSNPMADITDVYSWMTGANLNLVMDVSPFDDGVRRFDPSVLYVNMLLMGDRYNGSGYQTAQFDNLWGAGRLRLRRFDMMDAPARWETGNVCVDDGTSVTIDLWDKEIPSKTGGVDFVKVVAWWYDHRHDTGTDHDKIDMELLGDYVGGGAGAPAYWTASNDNKLMMYWGLSGYSSDWKWHVRLNGRDVTSDAEGCGSNSALVYYALIWEDQDRNEDAWFNTHIRPM